jgi:predicted RNA-binding Zn-ribbon protein involved in translation (DUF1610 family)
MTEGNLARDPEEPTEPLLDRPAELRRLDRAGQRGRAHMTTRAVPFYCPYCGEEDLQPHGPADGEWHCRSFTRTFRLNMTPRGAP